MLPKDCPAWQRMYWWFRRLMRRFLSLTLHDKVLMFDWRTARRQPLPPELRRVADWHKLRYLIGRGATLPLLVPATPSGQLVVVQIMLTRHTRQPHRRRQQRLHDLALVLVGEASPRFVAEGTSDKGRHSEQRCPSNH